MNIANAWNMASGACQTGITFAKRAMSSSYNRVYRILTKGVQAIQTRTVLACHGDGLVAKAAKAAVVATSVLSKYAEENFTKERMADSALKGMMAASIGFGAQDVSGEGITVLFLLSILTMMTFSKFQNKAARLVVNSAETILGGEMILIATKIVGLLRPYISTPSCTAGIILAAKYQYESSKNIELFHHVGTLALSVQGMKILGHQFYQSPPVATIAALAAGVFFLKVDRFSIGDGKNNPLKTLQFIGGATLANTLQSPSSSKENTKIFVCYQLSGLFAGSLFSELNGDYWGKTFASAKHKAATQLFLKENAKVIFPTEIVTIINEYLVGQKINQVCALEDDDEIGLHGAAI